MGCTLLGDGDDLTVGILVPLKVGALVTVGELVTRSVGTGVGLLGRDVSWVLGGTVPIMGELVTRRVGTGVGLLGRDVFGVLGGAVPVMGAVSCLKKSEIINKDDAMKE